MGGEMTLGQKAWGAFKIFAANVLTAGGFSAGDIFNTIFGNDGGTGKLMPATRWLFYGSIGAASDVGKGIAAMVSPKMSSSDFYGDVENIEGLFQDLQALGILSVDGSVNKDQFGQIQGPADLESLLLDLGWTLEEGKALSIYQTIEAYSQ